MAENNNYHIKIETEGVLIDREVPKEVGDKIIVLLMTSKAGSAVSDVSTASLVQRDTGEECELSLREFIDDRNPKRNPDMITTIAFYYEKYLSKKSFTSTDLLKSYEEASEPRPKNFSRDIKWTLRLGWIAPKQGQKETFYITTSGKDAVLASFPLDLIKKTKHSPSLRSNKNLGN